MPCFSTIAGGADISLHNDLRIGQWRMHAYKTIVEIFEGTGDEYFKQCLLDGAEE